MFKSLNSLVNRRIFKLKKIKDKDSLIRAAFTRFLKKQFGESLSSKIYYSLTYNDKTNSLIIKSDNKALANELSFRIKELAESIKEDNIKLDQIIIQ